MSEHLNYYLFGGPNDPKIVLLGPIFNSLLKVAQFDMYTKTDTKPVESLLVLEPKVAQKLGL